MAIPQAQKTFFDFSGGWNTEASPLNIPPQDATTIENVRINPGKGVSYRPAFNILGAGDNQPEELYDDGTTLYFGMSVARRWVRGSRSYLVMTRGKYLYIYNYEAEDDLKELDNYLARFEIDPRVPLQILDERENLLIINEGVYWLTYDPAYTPYHPDIIYQQSGDFVLQDVPLMFRNLRLVPEESYSAYYTNGYTANDPRDENTGTESQSPEQGRTFIPLETHVVDPTNIFANSDYYSERVLLTFNGRNVSIKDALAGGEKVNRYWEIYERAGIDNAFFHGVDGPPSIGETVGSFIVPVAHTSPIGGSRSGGYDTNVNTQKASDVAVGMTYGGRAWFASPKHPGTVFFSQTITHEKHIGRCWSIADPRNPYDSTIVDTDGGFININGAGNIHGLVPYSVGLMVFADNGIWYIRGLAVDEMFQTTAYSVEQVWSQPTLGFGCVARVNESVMFLAPSGVHIITKGQQEEYQVIKVSTKIESYLRQLNPITARQARIFYDDVARKCYILHNLEVEDWMPPNISFNYPCWTKCYRVLIFDLPTQAWYLYTIDNGDNPLYPGMGAAPNAPGIGCIFSGLGFNNTTAEIEDNNGDTVVLDSGSEVLGMATSDSNDYEYNVYIVVTSRAVGTGAWRSAIGKLAGDGYGNDWNNFAADFYWRPYTATLITAYNHFDDLVHKKEVPYITFLMERTETGEFDGDDLPTNPGGLLFAADWNWSDSSNSQYYGTLRPIYFPDRLTYSKIPLSNEGHPYIRYKKRVRGFGPVLQLRFSNDGAKAFTLLGWQVAINASGRMQ